MLRLFNLDLDLSFNPSDVLSDYMIDRILKRFPVDADRVPELSLVVNRVLGFVKHKQQVKVADVLDFILPFVRHDDFILKKKYKIKQQVSTVNGKWPQTYGNAYFLDSRFLLKDLADMAMAKVQAFLERNDFE